MREMEENTGAQEEGSRGESARGCEVSCDPVVSPNVVACPRPLLAPSTHFNGHRDA